MNGTSRPAFAVADLTGWQTIDTAPEEVLLLVYVWHSSPDGGPERLGYDLAWMEYGEWMYSSKDNEPHPSYRPSHWMLLPEPPEGT